MDEYIIALLKCKGIGNSKLLKYIENNKFDISIIKKNIKSLITESDYENFDTILEEAKEEIEISKKNGINLITILDDRFPTKLYYIKDPVIYLYYKGNIDLLKDKSVGVVGTRKPSNDVVLPTKRICQEIINNNYTIVSGLALGIDKIAHETCVDNSGKTIAVLPSSINDIQPISNKSLAEKILKENGCIVSEYSTHTPINKFNYAKRDRIISALSNAIVVPEAQEKSGTMITVNNAFESNKDVYQFNTNNNSLIDKRIDINNSDSLKQVFNSVEENYSKEVSKTINEQLVLF